MFERRGVEHQVDALHGPAQPLAVADVAEQPADPAVAVVGRLPELEQAVFVVVERAHHTRPVPQDLAEQAGGDGTRRARDQDRLAADPGAGVGQAHVTLVSRQVRRSSTTPARRPPALMAPKSVSSKISKCVPNR